MYQLADLLGGSSYDLFVIEFFGSLLTTLHVLSRFLCSAVIGPNSDQHQISPCNISAQYQCTGVVN